MDCRIPTKAISPYVREWIAQHEYLESTGIGPVEMLSRDTGINIKTITNIEDEKYEGTEFDIADKLLCKMGLVRLWFGPLRDIYYAVQFRQPTRPAPPEWSCIRGESHRGRLRPDDHIYCLDCANNRRRAAKELTRVAA